MTASRSDRAKSPGTLVSLIPADARTLSGGDEDSKSDEELLQFTFRKLTTQTVLEYTLLTVARHKISDFVDTAAVALMPGGDVELHVNADYMRNLGSDGFVFVLAHEALHLLDDDLADIWGVRNDPLAELATEAVTNYRVSQHLGRGLPVDRDGKKQGVDPDALYRQYAKAVDDPVSKQKFLESKIACLTYLRQMPKPPKVKAHFCHHVSPEAGGIPHRIPGVSQPGEGPDESGQAPTPLIDPTEAERVVSAALGALVQDALNGDEESRKVLLDMEVAFPNAKIWGNLGLGALRGEKVQTKKTVFWEQTLRRVVGSRLLPGSKIAYNKKLWWSKTLLPCGKEPQKKVVTYNDASGSMGAKVLEVVQRIVTQIPGVELQVHWFDTAVYEGEPGGEILGGGGTSFEPIVNHVAELETEPDSVIVITDGYAPKIDPPNKADWIWIITPGGDPWPADMGMETIVVDDLSLMEH